MAFEGIIKRYVFSPVCSNMYVIIPKVETEALIIDPNISQEARLELIERGIRSVKILLTHEHYDHTTGVNWFKESFESRLICHEKCAEAIHKERNNRPLVIAALLMKKGKSSSEIVLDKLPQNYICQADETFAEEIQMDWCAHSVKFVPTPGHTLGSCCIELDDQYVFTGDSLIQHTPVITRFPTGSLKDYDSVTRPYLESISSEYHVMPGHGETFLMKEVRY